MESVVTLNVGGEFFSTSLQTLRLSGSPLLSRLAVPQEADSFPRDSQGRPFIDRDPSCFRVLLNFLRSSVLELPLTMTEAAIIREADYYRITLPGQVVRGSPTRVELYFDHQGRAQIECYPESVIEELVPVFGEFKRTKPAGSKTKCSKVEALSQLAQMGYFPVTEGNPSVTYHHSIKFHKRSFR
eukprot:TRINITY_DN2626_c0_g1_i2.p1 TRINITY_DN2626_c0_g1~~TRINITY_DN2626_c0_g1_i2.p1  ORF type:complete len:185 (+),score=20.12 TRINITY_DN2626_c0_g1_i2:176-730(+)